MEGGGFFEESPPQPWWSRWQAVELLAVFCLGVALMSLFYTQPGEPPGKNVGVPGYDSGYHIKMAVLMPKIGFIDCFPWLRTTIFFQDRFVSHHWGFQALMIPFMKAAEWLGRDAMTGGRWAITFFFACMMVAFHLHLLAERVPYRWLWVGLFLALPSQFFGRLAFVRAIDLSLLCMLLILFFMFRRRYVAAGIAVAVYIHIYLGGLLYAPVLVASYFIGGLLAPQGQRVSWRVILWTLLGWCIGLRTHPYFDGAIEFLKVQVLGSGLSPDISVGREWESYEGVWWFVRMSAVLWLVWAAAIAFRLRLQRPVNAREWALLFISCVFLVLTCKSRRFVEYWPLFTLLSAAYLLAPLFRELLPDLFDRKIDEIDPGWRATLSLLMAFVCLAVITYSVYKLRHLGIENVVAEWRVWLLLAALYFLAPMARWWVVTQPPRLGAFGAVATVVAVPVSGALLIAVLVAACRLAFRGVGLPPPLLTVSAWMWVAVAALYVIVPAVAVYWSRSAPAPAPAGRFSTSLAFLFTGVGYALLLLLTTAAQLTDLQRSVYCGFDLAAIERAMTFLKENTPEHSVVFTDDWDIFPTYFYYNDHNDYIVGLDPKFTHSRDPVLWERYTRLSRGEYPTDREVTYVDCAGERVTRKIHVSVDDIIDYFGCQYVITDLDHQSLARKLEADERHAERIYPVAGSPDDVAKPPYKIFRVFRPGQADAGRSKPRSTQPTTQASVS